MIGPFLDRLWISLFPILAPTVGSNINEVLGSVEIQTKLVGNWSLVGLFLIMSVFNLIGEEFLFRGVLLPKMEGVFGKYDWVFNGVMMGAYHWHQPWTIPGAVVASIFCFSFPAKRFRSTCLSMVIHSIQFLFVIPGIIIIVLGLGP
jgi:membrane protease YdiL (CAAX protease family)